MSKKSSDGVLYGIFGLMLIAGVVLLYKFVSLKPQGQGEIAAPAVSNNINPKKNAPTKAIPLNTNPLSVTSVRKVQIKLPDVKPNISPEKKIKLKSTVTQNRFSKVTLLKMKWPEGLDYIETDMEDGMKTIYGFNPHTKEGLTAVARPGITTMGEIQKYLKTDAGSIPNLKGEEIKSLSTPTPLKNAKRKSGISDIEIMQAELKSGKSAHVALVNRKDKEGSYIFVFTAPKGMIESNDGYVEQIYDSIRILPKKKK